MTDNNDLSLRAFTENAFAEYYNSLGPWGKLAIRLRKARRRISEIGYRALIVLLLILRDAILWTMGHLLDSIDKFLVRIGVNKGENHVEYVWYPHIGKVGRMRRFAGKIHWYRIN